MREMLPSEVNINGCGILNLDSFDGNGTHWVYYYKLDNISYYFDSYGKIIDKSPKELVNYLGIDNLYFNDYQIQNYNDPPICEHLCVYILNEMNKNVIFENIINKLLLNKYTVSKYS